MSRIRHAFTRDLGRKALALALAVFIWWRVSAAIEENFQRTIFVYEATGLVESNSASAQANQGGQIRVTLPEGWILVSPKSGSDTPLNMRGARIDVEDFMAEGAIAELTLTIPPGSSNDSAVTISHDLADLNWRRGAQARLLLAGVPKQELEFKLARSESVTAQILTSEIEITGKLADGFSIARDQMKLAPDTVTVTGPVDHLPARDADGSVQLGSLLEALQLPAGTTNDFEIQLSLSESAEAEGIKMQPESVVLNVPVVAEGLEPFSILPTPGENIQTIGEAPEGQWSVERYKGVNFTVTYTHDARILEPPTQEELERMITFIVDLSTVPALAEDGHEVPIDWMLRGANEFADRTQYIALRDALEILPNTNDYASLVVSLDKLEQE